VIGEFAVAGVFVPALLVWAVAAMAIGAAVRRLLRVIGFYRLVWHRGLFDLALFFILWGLVAAVVDFYNVSAGSTR
jgi:hypothetical protein